MKNKIVAFSIIFIGLCVVFFWQSANSQPAKLHVGSIAPEFSLKNSSGNSVQLADYKGKTVVLEWTNPDCPFVKRHYKAGTMKQLAASNPDVVWLAINSSNFANQNVNSSWKSEQAIPYPILDDSSGEVGHEFDARTTPHMFIIDKEGVLRYQGAIDDDPYGSKEVAEVNNYVAAALKEIQNDNQVSIPETKSYGCSVKYAG